MGFLIVFHLVRVGNVALTVPCVNLQHRFSNLRSNECPTLWIETVNVLLGRMGRILQLQVLMVTFVRLPVACSNVCQREFIYFLNGRVGSYANHA